MRELILPVLIGFFYGIVLGIVGFSVSDWEYWLILLPSLLFIYLYSDIQERLTKKKDN